MYHHPLYVRQPHIGDLTRKLTEFQQQTRRQVEEPYVYEALTSLVGKRIVLDTTRGSVSGTLIDAKPDHVVIQEYDSTFYVRIKEIVWIMPENIRGW